MLKIVYTNKQKESSKMLINNEKKMKIAIKKLLNEVENRSEIKKELELWESGKLHDIFFMEFLHDFLNK